MIISDKRKVEEVQTLRKHLNSKTFKPEAHPPAREGKKSLE